MAEGWARHLKGDSVEAHSAGVIASGLNPRAVAVMAEAGVDISPQRSKTVSEFADRSFDYVVTLCDHARESCPFLPGAKKHVHRGFDDPPSLAPESVCEEDALAVYRRVRDEIRGFVEGMPACLEETGAEPSAPAGPSA